MALFSALEDFVQRSLAPLPTLWEKLRFVGDLREQGHYRHWGMEQKFGEEASQDAITHAHVGLCEEMVSTRMSELWLALDQAAYREKRAVNDYMSDLADRKLKPADLEGVAPEHFDFVVANLCRVARSRSTPSRSVA